VQILRDIESITNLCEVQDSSALIAQSIWFNNPDQDDMLPSNDVGWQVLCQLGSVGETIWGHPVQQPISCRNVRPKG